jgi:hypothetical protein
MINSSHEFPLPIFLGTDQPETCRLCGGRTQFHVYLNGHQIHECLICKKVYFLEFEDEGD